MLRQESDVDDAMLARPTFHIEAADVFPRLHHHQPVRIGMLRLIMRVLRAELHIEEASLFGLAPRKSRELAGAGRSI